LSAEDEGVKDVSVVEAAIGVEVIIVFGTAAGVDVMIVVRTATGVEVIIATGVDTAEGLSSVVGAISLAEGAIISGVLITCIDSGSALSQSVSNCVISCLNPYDMVSESTAVKNLVPLKSWRP
jgi:hypothetical protein